VYHTYMAARKPKDVSAWLGGNRGTVQSGGGTTNPEPTPAKSSVRPWGPFGFVQDIISPWLSPQPGQNKSVTQAQGLARAAAETLDQTVTGGLVQAGTQGNKALAKQAAINAAAAATGAGVAKIAGKVLPVVVKSKIGETVSRLSGKDVVGVHVSPVPGLREIVSPSNASRGSGMGPLPGKPVVPDVTYKVSTVGNWRSNISPSIVTNKSVGLGDTYYSKKGFSAYVTRSPVGKADPEQPLSGISRITENQKVVAEVKFPKYSSVPEDFNEWGRLPKTREGKQLRQQIRQAQENVYQESFNNVSNSAVRGATAVGFGAGVVINKKKGRGSGVKKK